MNVSILYGNRFFSEGCQEVFKDINDVSSTFSKNVVVVDFSVNNINVWSGYDWIVSLRDSLVILICDLQLLPIAGYFQNKFEKIIAVFTSNEPIKSISSFFESYDSKKARKEAPAIPLSEREFLFLAGILQGINASVEAKRKNLSVKTIYTHRKNIVNKLGSRKISPLYRFNISD